MKYDLSRPNALSATRSEREGGKCTVCVYSQRMHYHAVLLYIIMQCSAISCNSVQCSIVQFVSACVQCFSTAALWRSSIHLYLIWSGTMCERGAAFHKNGWTTTHCWGIAPGRNQNHYTPIYHLLLKDHHTKLMCNSFKSLSVMLHENPSHAKPDILLGCWNVIKSWFYTTPAVQKLHISFYQQIPFGGATMICALLCYFLKNMRFILNICAMQGRL